MVKIHFAHQGLICMILMGYGSVAVGGEKPPTAPNRAPTKTQMAVTQNLASSAPLSPLQQANQAWKQAEAVAAQADEGQKKPNS